MCKPGDIILCPDARVLYRVEQFQTPRHRKPMTIMYFAFVENALWALNTHDCKIVVTYCHIYDSEYISAVSNSSLPVHKNDMAEYGHALTPKVETGDPTQAYGLTYLP
jgi:hypothetical protein